MTTLVETPIEALGNIRIESDTDAQYLLTEPSVLRLRGQEKKEAALYVSMTPIEAKRMATLCYWLTEHKGDEAAQVILEDVGDAQWAALGERFERVPAFQQ